MFLTEEQTKEFRDKGFIVSKSFFDKAAMDKVSAHLDELRDKKPGENQEAKYYEKSPITGESILVRIENVIGDHNPELDEALSEESELALEGEDALGIRPQAVAIRPMRWSGSV